MLAHDFQPGFRVRLHHKYLGIFTAAARASGVAVLAGEGGRRLGQRAHGADDRFEASVPEPPGQVREPVPVGFDHGKDGAPVPGLRRPHSNCPPRRPGTWRASGSTWPGRCSTRDTATHAATLAGFPSYQSLRRVFARELSISPAAYQRRFSTPRRTNSG